MQAVQFVFPVGAKMTLLWANGSYTPSFKTKIWLANQLAYLKGN